MLASTFPRWEDDTTPPFVFELCRRLARRFEVHVLAPHAPGAAGEQRMDGIHVHRYRYAPESLERLAYDGGILARLRAAPWLALLIPVFLLAQVVALWRMRRLADVVHAHWVLPQGLLAVAVTDRPVLCTAHGGDLFSLRSALSGWLKRWTLRRVTKLAVVSPALADEARRNGVADDSMVVAPMGVDLQQSFRPVEGHAATPNHLLFVGRLVAKKGVEVLVRAMPAILAAHPDAVLNVVGDGPERAALEALSDAQGTEAAIRFHGPVPNRELPDRFRSASVVAFPSLIAADGDREGFGLVAVEALGCGCAVVGSDLPAMQEFLRHEETGLVTRAGDADALAAAINRLLEDGALRERLGRSGREFVLARYDWERVAQRYAGLLEGLAAGAADRP